MDSQAPRISQARGPPLWDECDAQMGQGVKVGPDWDLAAQPAPDYETFGLTLAPLLFMAIPSFVLIGFSNAIRLTIQCFVGDVVRWIDQDWGGMPSYPTHPRALCHNCIQALCTDTSPPVQLICTLRNTRSGCGIIAVKRPSAVVTAVRPAGLPLGL